MSKNNDQKPIIAYILKNFPKLSETFIASEIYRLEQLGVNLKLFVIKPPIETSHHAVVDKIRAEKFNLPATGSLTETSFFTWLKTYLPKVSPAAFSVAKQKPIQFLCAAARVCAQSFRARKSFFAAPKKKYLKEFLQAAMIACEILKDENIQHIHAHFAHESATVAWLAAEMCGRKFSFTAHAKDIYLESLNPAGLLKRKMDAAQFVVTCTLSNQTHLQAISPTPVHCLYHGLSADFTDLLTAQSDVSNRRSGILRALAVGRLVRKKGFDVFVEACGILRDRGINLEAVIVGETGDHAAEIELVVKRLNLGKVVKFTGALSQNQLFAEYRNAAVFCLPCRILENGDRDGIPNVMMEAMSSGLPTITTDISGIPEIVRHNENGLLVAPEDANALADAMQKIYADEKLSERLSRSAIAVVKEKFDGETTARLLANLFAEEMKQSEINVSRNDEVNLAVSFKARAN